MAVRLSVLFATLIFAGCVSSNQSPPTASCDDVVEHAIDLRLEGRLEHVPEAERDAHHEALSRGLTPTYRTACERMTANERACWGAATSADEVADCGLPTTEDATAIARTPAAPFKEN